MVLPAPRGALGSEYSVSRVRATCSFIVEVFALYAHLGVFDGWRGPLVVHVRTCMFWRHVLCVHSLVSLLDFLSSCVVVLACVRGERFRHICDNERDRQWLRVVPTKVVRNKSQNKGCRYRCGKYSLRGLPWVRHAEGIPSLNHTLTHYCQVSMKSEQRSVTIIVSLALSRYQQFF